MEVLARIRVASGQLQFGVATSSEERAAATALRFRVYQRRGYYRPGLVVDRDEHDGRAVHFLGMLQSGTDRPGVPLGSVRVIPAGAEPGFRFPCEGAFRFELPEPFRRIPIEQCAEVGRLVAEQPEAIGLSNLLIPLGLMHAICAWGWPRGFRLGLATIKRRLLRALRGAGLRLAEIPSARLIYPLHGPVSGYFYRHQDPVVPVCWLGEEVIPQVRRAIAQYQDSRRVLPAVDPSAASSRGPFTSDPAS